MEAAIDAFSIIDASVSSSEDILVNINVQVYPNPFDNYIMVSSPDSELKSYAIYDAIGNLVQKGNLANKTSKIETNLASGIYTLKLNDIDDQLVIKKIVKKYK
jgi:hypothetical protein